MIAATLMVLLAGLAIGRMALRDEALATRLGALAVGVLAIAVVLSIPYLGALVGFVVLIFALGGICLWLVGPAQPQSFAPLPAAKPIPASLA